MPNVQVLIALIMLYEQKKKKNTCEIDLKIMHYTRNACMNEGIAPRILNLYGVKWAPLHLD
jgi:hypothetical protein